MPRWSGSVTHKVESSIEVTIGSQTSCPPLFITYEVDCDGVTDIVDMTVQIGDQELQAGWLWHNPDLMEAAYRLCEENEASILEGAYEREHDEDYDDWAERHRDRAAL